LVVEGTFANTTRTYSYGAHSAHVAVDSRTGHVEVLDYLAVEDVGRAVNPAIVHGRRSAPCARPGWRVLRSFDL